MHEHGLADHIVARALQHPDRPQDASPVAVTIMVSELAGLTQEALQLALDHVCEHHHIPRIRLHLQAVGLLGECRQCGEVSPVDEELVCPVCLAQDARLCAGEIAIITACQYA